LTELVQAETDGMSIDELEHAAPVTLQEEITALRRQALAAQDQERNVAPRTSPAAARGGSARDHRAGRRC
jgi:hypothetical protein